MSSDDKETSDAYKDCITGDGEKVDLRKIDADLRKELLDFTEGKDELIYIVVISHLLIEHYLTDLIQKKNPNLNDLSSSRLSFANKLELLNTSTNNVLPALKNAIKNLNTIRNQCAHNLHSELNSKNVEVLRFFLKDNMGENEDWSNDMKVIQHFTHTACFCLVLEGLNIRHMYSEEVMFENFIELMKKNKPDWL